MIDVDDSDVEVLPPEPPTTVAPLPPPPSAGSRLPVRQPPAGPPGPPAPPPAAPSPWWSGRRGLYVAAGAFAVVAVIAIVATLSLRGKNEQLERAGEVLQSSQTDVSDSSQKAADAAKLKAIQRAGDAAAKDATSLRATTDQVAAVEDEEIRAATRRQVDAEIAYLEALTGLRRVGFGAVEDEGVPVWRAAKRRLELATRDIAAANAAVQKLEIPGDVTVDIKALQTTTATLDKNIRTASKRLRSWRQRQRDWRSRRDEAQARAREFDAGYSAPVQQELERYNGDRRKVDAFAQKVDSMPTIEAQAAVASFITDRQRTIDRLNGLQPDNELSAAHQGLTRPVEESLEGLLAAQTAVASAAGEDLFSDDSDVPDEKVTAQPAWRQFQEISDNVDTEIGRSRGTWDNAVATHRNRLATEGVGRNPRRPDV